MVIIHLLRNGEGNMKIYSPKKNIIPQRLCPKEIVFFWGNKIFIFPEHSSNTLFHYTERHMVIQIMTIINSFSTFQKQYRRNFFMPYVFVSIYFFKFKSRTLKLSLSYKMN